MTTASEPTLALLHVSSSFSVRMRICQTSRLVRSQPPLHSVRSLRSSLIVLCGTAPVDHWSVSGWLRSVLSQLHECLPCNGCVLLLVSCYLAGFLYSPCGHGEQLFKWNAVCLCVPGYTFLFSGMRWVWHLENYYRHSPLFPTMGCPVQLLLFECLRLLVNECPLLPWAAANCL